MIIPNHRNVFPRISIHAFDDESRSIPVLALPHSACFHIPPQVSSQQKTDLEVHLAREVLQKSELQTELKEVREENTKLHSEMLDKMKIIHHLESKTGLVVHSKEEEIRMLKETTESAIKRKQEEIDELKKNIETLSHRKEEELLGMEARNLALQRKQGELEAALKQEKQMNGKITVIMSDAIRKSLGTSRSSRY